MNETTLYTFVSAISRKRAIKLSELHIKLGISKSKLYRFLKQETILEEVKIQQLASILELSETDSETYTSLTGTSLTKNCSHGDDDVCKQIHSLLFGTNFTQKSEQLFTRFFFHYGDDILIKSGNSVFADIFAGESSNPNIEVFMSNCCDKEFDEYANSLKSFIKELSKHTTKNKFNLNHVVTFDSNDKASGISSICTLFSYFSEFNNYKLFNAKNASNSFLSSNIVVIKITTDDNQPDQYVVLTIMPSTNMVSCVKTHDTAVFNFFYSIFETEMQKSNVLSHTFKSMQELNQLMITSVEVGRDTVMFKPEMCYSKLSESILNKIKVRVSKGNDNDQKFFYQEISGIEKIEFNEIESIRDSILATLISRQKNYKQTNQINVYTKKGLTNFVSSRTFTDSITNFFFSKVEIHDILNDLKEELLNKFASKRTYIFDDTMIPFKHFIGAYKDYGILLTFSSDIGMKDEKNIIIQNAAIGNAFFEYAETFLPMQNTTLSVESAIQFVETLISNNKNQPLD